MLYLKMFGYYGTYNRPDEDEENMGMIRVTTFSEADYTTIVSPDCDDYVTLHLDLVIVMTDLNPAELCDLSNGGWRKLRGCRVHWDRADWTINDVGWSYRDISLDRVANSLVIERII